MALLEVNSLSIDYRTSRGVIHAVEDISFSMGKNDMLGLAGESGSGKSTLGLSLLRLVPYPGVIADGQIMIGGRNILSLSEEEMRRLRGKDVAYIFQDPMTSLNPVKRIGSHFVELITTHEPSTKNVHAIERAKKILDSLGIQSERLNDYPHQFSGGMRQRIMIGLAIALNPILVVADEPTTALDVIVQAKILDLLESLQKSYGLAVILISHDLSIILERCSSIVVMYAGHMVEYASSKELYRSPLHPYTQGLLKSIPNIELEDQKLSSIPGSPPDMLTLPKGCRFRTRCSRAGEKCQSKAPALIEVGNKHFVRCHEYVEEGVRNE